MSHNDITQKLRHWDNLAAKWFLRHFYFLFFQIILVFVFIFWFITLFRVINISLDASPINISDQFLAVQSIQTSVIVFLLILNSFWVLHIFNGMQRMLNVLKEVSFGINKLQQRSKKP